MLKISAEERQKLSKKQFPPEGKYFRKKQFS
jgi:hypothetical protein